MCIYRRENNKTKHNKKHHAHAKDLDVKGAFHDDDYDDGVFLIHILYTFIPFPFFRMHTKTYENMLDDENI